MSRPVAGPVASSRSLQKPRSQPAGLSDPQATGSVSRRPDRYLTPRRLRELAAALSDRERSVTTSIDRLRMASGAQLERLHFADVTDRECRRTLAGLVERRFLYRLPRVVGGQRAGSHGFVYAPGIATQRLRPGRRSQRPWVPGTTFIAHSLAVTETFVRLIEAQRRREVELCVFEAEPGCWRHYVGTGGAPQVVKPDAYIQLTLGNHVDHWFLEIDMATQSSSTLETKCAVYRAYWGSGTEQERHGAFPRVVFAVTTDERQALLREIFASQPADARALFTVCRSQDVIARFIEGADR